MTPLAWGRSYLMCPPDQFAILYEINPWMHREVGVDPDRSRTQWEGLAALLKEAGAAVEIIEPVEGLPDMVFTANAGVVDGRRFVVSRFRHLQRSPEAGHFARWFEARGFGLSEMPAGLHLEGAGDALPFGGRLLAGYRFRSDFPAHTVLASVLGVEVLSVELIDPRFYHLDLTFCPLDERRAMVVPDAWDRYGAEVVANLVPEPVVLDLDEALAFCTNSVVVGSTVIMPACSPLLERRLNSLGFEVAVCPVDEFLKAGGGSGASLWRWTSRSPALAISEGWPETKRNCGGDPPHEPLSRLLSDRPLLERAAPNDHSNRHFRRRGEDLDAAVVCCDQHLGGVLGEQAPPAEEKAHESQNRGPQPFASPASVPRSAQPPGRRAARTL